MDSAVIALDGVIFKSHASLAQIGISVERTVLPVIIKSHYDLECRTGRILSHGCPVQKAAVRLVAYQPVPVLPEGVGVEVRLADHGKDLPCVRLHNNNRAPPVAQSVIRRGLQIRPQGGDHSISHILPAQEFVLHLGEKKLMGAEKLEIGFGFQSAFAVGIVSDHMGKNIGVRIDSVFCPVVIHVSPGQNFPVGGKDLASDNPVGKRVLPCIVRTVNKSFTFGCIEIDKVSDQTGKNNHKKSGNKTVLPVSGTFFLIFLRICGLPLSPGFSVQLLFFVSQILRPRLLLKYKVPG